MLTSYTQAVYLRGNDGKPIKDLPPDLLRKIETSFLVNRKEEFQDYLRSMEASFFEDLRPERSHEDMVRFSRLKGYLRLDNDPEYMRFMGLEHTGLAEGGIVTEPMAAEIGEAGPEAVVPLTSEGLDKFLTPFLDSTATEKNNQIAAEMAKHLRELVALQKTTQENAARQSVERVEDDLRLAVGVGGLGGAA